MSENIINIPVLEPSQLSYSRIWNQLIDKAIKDFTEKIKGVQCRLDAEQLIWENYKALNYWCKIHYMKRSDEKIDRHKTCACYIYAILQADVLSCIYRDIETGPNDCRRYQVLNEELAVTVGLSLLRRLIEFNVSKEYEDFPEIMEQYLPLIKDGILLPKCNHGIYRNNLVSQLHFAKKEHNYDILGMANTLFLLEKYTLGISCVDEHKTEDQENISES